MIKLNAMHAFLAGAVLSLPLLASAGEPASRTEIRRQGDQAPLLLAMGRRRDENAEETQGTGTTDNATGGDAGAVDDTGTTGTTTPGGDAGGTNTPGAGGGPGTTDTGTTGAGTTGTGTSGGGGQ